MSNHYADKWTPERCTRYRTFLGEESGQALIRLALSALSKGKKREDVALIVIDVDDYLWRSMVDHLMPNATEKDWQAYRNDGAVPMARGSVERAGLASDLSTIAPEVAKTLASPPDKGFYVVVLGAGGVSVYPLDPTNFD